MLDWHSLASNGLRLKVYCFKKVKKWQIVWNFIEENAFFIKQKNVWIFGNVFCWLSWNPRTCYLKNV